MVQLDDGMMHKYVRPKFRDISQHLDVAMIMFWCHEEIKESRKKDDFVFV